MANGSIESAMWETAVLRLLARGAPDEFMALARERKWVSMQKMMLEQEIPVATGPLSAYCLAQLCPGTHNLGMDSLRRWLCSTTSSEQFLAQLLLSLAYRHMGLLALAEAFLTDALREHPGMVHLIESYIPDCMSNMDAVVELGSYLSTPYGTQGSEVMREHESSEEGKRFRCLYNRVGYYSEQLGPLMTSYQSTTFIVQNLMQWSEDAFDIFKNIVPDESVPCSYTLPFSLNVIDHLARNPHILRDEVNPDHLQFFHLGAVTAELLFKDGSFEKAWELLGSIITKNLRLEMDCWDIPDAERIYVVILATKCFLKVSADLSLSDRSSYLMMLLDLYAKEGANIDLYAWKSEGTLGHFFIYYGLLTLDAAMTSLQKCNSNVNEEITATIRKLVIGVNNLHEDDFLAQEIYPLICTLLMAHGGFNIKILYAMELFALTTGRASEELFPIIHEQSTVPSYLSSAITQARGIQEELMALLLHQDLRHICRDDLSLLQAYSLKRHLLVYEDANQGWFLELVDEEDEYTDEQLLHLSDTTEELIYCWINSYKSSRGELSNSLNTLLLQILQVRSTTSNS